MLKKILLTVLLTAILGAPSALAFRLEGYNWGDSKASVLEKLEKKDWDIRSTRTKQMIEADVFLGGEPCVAQFMFNDALRLNKIRVTWDTTRVGDDIRKRLLRDFGNPSEVSPGAKHYMWKGYYKGEEITLDYSDLSGLNKTTIVFDGGSAYR
ncbi:MAG: hypothetical protein V1882_05265 [Candidatus Omnitrophota bacterium]